MEFKTLSDLLAASRRSPVRGWSDGSVSGLTRKQAFHLAEFGWPEGARKAAKQAEAVATRAIKAVEPIDEPKLIADVMGGAYDVGTLMSGVPEAWMRPQEIKDKKEVRIIVNVACSAAVGEEQLMARGIAVTALALALQAAGYGVTIDAYEGWAPGRYTADSKANPEMEMYCRIADAGSGSQLDVDRIVYCLAHPTFSRYIAFDVTYLMHAPPGSPSKLPENCSLYIDGMRSWTGEWQHPEEWVARQFTEQTQA